MKLGPFIAWVGSLLALACYFHYKTENGVISDTVTLDQKDNAISVGDAKKVLVFAYYRSGSTLFSDVFSLNNNTFFVYEPLRAVEEFLKQQGKMENLEDVNNKARRREVTPEWFNFVTEVLENFFLCNLEKIPEFVLKFEHMRTGTPWFFQCQFDQPFQKCVQNLIKVCKSAKIRLIKIIRVHDRTDIFEHMFNTVPGLRIFHLIRDPRGIINSRALMHQMTRADTLEPLIKTLCKYMERDICDTLYSSEPGKIEKVIYEEMAENPVRVIQKSYAALQLNPPQELVDLIVSKCHAEHKTGVFRTDRENSSRTAHAWRQKFPLWAARLVDKHCGIAYRYGGYLKLQSDDHLPDYRIKTRIDGSDVSARQACKEMTKT